MISQKIKNWLKKQKKNHKLKIKVIKLKDIDKWKIDNSKIYHKTKNFFKIVGIKVLTNFNKKNWDQPMIVQNEVGILGIIKNTKTNKYLLQSKVEPGNINKLQLAPTVQATKSNYSRVHGGKKVPYINYFLKSKKTIPSLQSEQGFRYLNKFNSNILLKTSKFIEIKPEFYWFNKNEIKELIKIRNIINMDTLSVFSSFMTKVKKDYPINSIRKIYDWVKINNKKYFMKTKIVDLIKLKDWTYNSTKVEHKKKKHFSIIGINASTNKREIKNWSQPIIKGKEMAFAGFIKTKFNNIEHYLCRYTLKPGLKSGGISCTVNTSDINNYSKNHTLNSNEKYFIKKYFFSQYSKKNIIYDNILSDEGGRFYQCQIRYMISKLLYPDSIKIPNNYIWISHNQIVDMIRDQKLDIEARLLFACANLDYIY
jgi:oxidase EvaA